MFKEFSDIEYNCDTEKAFIKGTDGIKRVFGHCIALSEYDTIKTRGEYYNVKYIIFDEYITDNNSRYYHNWDEPSVFINICDTIDRNENRIMCFLCGNAIAFYNPYHLSPYFKLPYIEERSTWKNKNVLFVRIAPTMEWLDHQNKSVIREVTRGSNYHKAMGENAYTNDDYTLITPLTGNYRQVAMIKINGDKYSVNTTEINGALNYIISERYSEGCRQYYAYKIQDADDTYYYVPFVKNKFMQMFSRLFKMGRVRYTDIGLKNKIHNDILKGVR